MAWLHHHIKDIIQWACMAWSLLVLIRCAREGQFRRIWNWPMRIVVSCFALVVLLGMVGNWSEVHTGIPSVWRSVVGEIYIAVLVAGLLGLCVWVVGFLTLMVRDLRGTNKPQHLHPSSNGSAAPPVNE
jgi:type III secretory pathway component EscT